MREPMESTTDSFSIDKPVFMDLVVMCDIFTLMLINQSIRVYFVLIAIDMIAQLNDLTPIFRSPQLKFVLDQNNFFWKHFSRKHSFAILLVEFMHIIELIQFFIE